MPDLLVATFYMFVPLETPSSLEGPISECCERNEVRGTILLATEGINATISGTREGVMNVLGFLRSDPRFSTLTWKESAARTHPFGRMRVRLKKEIVTLGVPEADPCTLAGEYVKPKDWNALISDPDVLVIDTRNDYEVEIGTFQNAINPGIDSFSELTDWLDERIKPGEQPKVAMFCTGGIRCEKSTALLKYTGIEEVYHLEGGILKYLEEIPEEESMWEGTCFVFDDRISVGHGLAIVEHQLCPVCQYPLKSDDDAFPTACPRCTPPFDQQD